MTEIDTLLIVTFSYGCVLVLLAAVTVGAICALAYIVREGKACIQRLMDL
jgi:hypothetical protein